MHLGGLERLQRNPAGAPRGHRAVLGRGLHPDQHGQCRQRPRLDTLRRWGRPATLDAIPGAGQTLADAGTSPRYDDDEFSRTAGLFVALVPIVVVVGPWALIRYRFVRRATGAQEWLTRAGSLETFALRALVTLPLDRLEPLGPDVVSGFFRGDQATVRALAALDSRPTA